MARGQQPCRNMNTYYEVITTFRDNGKVTAHLATIEADAKPENTSKELHLFDVYYDYFDTLKEAKQWYNDALNA